MPCLIVLIAFLFPRLVIIGLALFSNYLQQAFTGLLFPILGFFFLPYATLAYAWVKNSHGTIDGWYLVAIIVAVLVDIGAMGEGADVKRRRAR